MSRNMDLLNSVSDSFTEKTLEDILAKATKDEGQDVRILSWDFGEASAKGDSYLSTVSRILVKGEVNGKPTEVKLVVKSLPKNLGRRKTFRSADFFYNEITFYEEVIPTFEKFIKSKGQPQLLNIPRCLASLIDGENDFIVLEDVTPLGFKPVTRQNSLDFAQCCFILEAMARFHAVSLAFKDQNKQEFEIMKSKIKETYFADELWEWYKRFHGYSIRITKDALEKEYPGSEAEQKFNSYNFGDLYSKSAEFCKRTDYPTSVINQGDSWAPNFLVQEIAPNEMQVLMLDFQLARCVSPVLDIAFLIYSCTDKQLRDKHFDEFLEIYHKEVSKSIELLGSNPQKLYSWTMFQNEVKEQFIHGMIFALEAIPFSMLSEEDSFDLDVIEGENKIDIADVWKVENIKTPEGRQRLADVIVHAEQRGFI
ncbi:uncharacterized protein LOC117176730 [Belonocnema kinseyi]|uniref:uncharacterized protein LOC117176730 n=1 Tax=Belonocnema kinseyi TaxID=2817044 RepID=UPI00143D7A54|nr:uncharacterized protein LOC117176730 [Belonocnema kinseyi]XP_033222888.1 uncharacterized protein LOC117176730 [Belonocnema kinseyi]